MYVPDEELVGHGANHRHDELGHVQEQRKEVYGVALRDALAWVHLSWRSAAAVHVHLK
jgi:hypothetical protein